MKKDVELEKKDAEEIVKKAASEIIADAKGVSWLDVSIREPEQKFRVSFYISHGSKMLLLMECTADCEEIATTRNQTIGLCAQHFWNAAGA